MEPDYPHVMLPWYHRAPADKGLAPQSAASGAAHAAMEDDVAQSFMQAQLRLAEELLGYIHAQTPEFFEHLIIDMLLALGYDGRRRDLAKRLGRGGDGGVDGLVAQDELGLDVIYFQVSGCGRKLVPVSDVRDFAGSLDATGHPGIFVATGHFSEAAQEL
jgi:restriction system protein